MEGKIYSQDEVNLHTHSFYCGHGTGTLKDYLESARSGGHLKVLGFSEHCQTPDNHFPDRMTYDVFYDYAEDVKFLSGETDIRILLGAECDWNSQYESYYRYLKEKLGFAYLAGSVHYYFDEDERRIRYIGRCRDFMPYLSDYVKRYTQMLSSPMFLFACHPDLFCYHNDWNPSLESAADEIISCAKQYNRILEINGQGFLKTHVREDGSTRSPYPVPEFWDMVRLAGVRCCINSDAHNPVHVYSTKAFEFAGKNNLEDLLVKWEVSSDGLTVRSVL